jgi:hypothetical protein
LRFGAADRVAATVANVRRPLVRRRLRGLPVSTQGRKPASTSERHRRWKVRSTGRCSSGPTTHDIKAEASADKGKLTVRVGNARYRGASPSFVCLTARAVRANRICRRTHQEAMEASRRRSGQGAADETHFPVHSQPAGSRSPATLTPYAVPLEAGQCLSAAVQGRRLGARWTRCSTCDDAAEPARVRPRRPGLDPLLVFRAASTGTYVVRVEGFKFPAGRGREAGGRSAGRLPPEPHGRLARAVRDARRACDGGQRRTSDCSTGTAESGTREVDASGALAWDEVVRLPTESSDGATPVAMGDAPELLEADVPPAATPASAPFAVTGRLAAAGDGIRFALPRRRANGWRCPCTPRLWRRRWTQCFG